MNGWRTRAGAAIVAAVVCLPILAACGGGDESPATTTTDSGDESTLSVRLAYPSAGVALADLAIGQERSFAAHHLDVEMQRIASGTTAVQALISGQIDVVRAAGPEIVSAIAEGFPLVWVSDVQPTLNFRMVGAKGTPVSADGVRGKRLGISRRGSSTDFAAGAALKDLGLTVADVQIVEVGQSPAIFPALQADAIDLAMLNPPWMIQAESDGFPTIVDLGKENTPYPTTGFATSTEYAQQHPEVLRRLIEAVRDAVKFIKESTEEAASIYIRVFKADDTDATRTSFTESAPLFSDTLEPDAEAIQAVIDAMGPTNPKIAALTVDDIIDPSFAR